MSRTNTSGPLPAAGGSRSGGRAVRLRRTAAGAAGGARRDRRPDPWAAEVLLTVGGALSSPLAIRPATTATAGKLLGNRSAKTMREPPWSGLDALTWEDDRWA